MIIPAFSAHLVHLIPECIWSTFEKHYARQLIHSLLDAYINVSSKHLELSGKPLYRAVLLHSQLLEKDSVDHFLGLAEDSVDAWTAPGRSTLGFREVVHYLLITRYCKNWRAGSSISFADIVATLVPDHL